MSKHARLSSPLTTSHVNKHLRYRLSKLGYAWLLLITCCLITLALQIISMATKEHLIGEAGGSISVSGKVFYGTMRRTYSIFHSCTAPTLEQTSISRAAVPSACAKPSSDCKEMSDRMRYVQASSIIALFFTTVPLLMMLVMVGSRSLRAKNPLLVSSLIMIFAAFFFRLVLWSLIVDFTTNTSLCNNAFLVVPGVALPRFGPSFIVEVISWIFLLITFVFQLLVIAFENGILTSRNASSSSSSSSSSSDDENGSKNKTQPTYEAKEDVPAESF